MCRARHLCFNVTPLLVTSAQFSHQLPLHPHILPQHPLPAFPSSQHNSDCGKHSQLCLNMPPLLFTSAQFFHQLPFHQHILPPHPLPALPQLPVQRYNVCSFSTASLTVYTTKKDYFLNLHFNHLKKKFQCRFPEIKQAFTVAGYNIYTTFRVWSQSHEVSSQHRSECAEQASCASM